MSNLAQPSGATIILRPYSTTSALVLPTNSLAKRSMKDHRCGECMGGQLLDITEVYKLNGQRFCMVAARNHTLKLPSQLILEQASSSLHSGCSHVSDTMCVWQCRIVAEVLWSCRVISLKAYRGVGLLDTSTWACAKTRESTPGWIHPYVNLSFTPGCAYPGIRSLPRRKGDPHPGVTVW